MKKTLALALAAVMSLGLLAGCGPKEPANNGGGTTNPPSSASQPQGGDASSIPDAPAGGGTVGVCIYKFDDAFMTTYRNALQELLSHPEDFIESREYFNWERFFTHILIQYTKDTYLHYSKQRLNTAYLHDRARDAILKVMEHISFE